MLKRVDCKHLPARPSRVGIGEVVGPSKSRTDSALCLAVACKGICPQACVCVSWPCIERCVRCPRWRLAALARLAKSCRRREDVTDHSCGAASTTYFSVKQPLPAHPTAALSVPWSAAKHSQTSNIVYWGEVCFLFVFVGLFLWSQKKINKIKTPCEASQDVSG